MMIFSDPDRFFSPDHAPEALQFLMFSPIHSIFTEVPTLALRLLELIRSLGKSDDKPPSHETRIIDTDTKINFFIT